MSDEEIMELTTQQLAEEMMRCKLSVFEKLKNGTMRMDDIEESLHQIREDLKRSEQQRASYSGEITKRLDKLDMWSTNHGREEMDKYTLIIDSINNLSETIKKTAEETEENTKLLAIKARKEEVESEVQKRLKDSRAEYHEYKKNAINAVIVMVALGIAGVIWELIIKAQ